MESRNRLIGSVAAVILGSLFVLPALGLPVNLFVPSAAHAAVPPASFGGLDCNGHSTIQQPVKVVNICTDVRGILGVNNEYTWGGRFYDNGKYVGHDEPDLTFLSSRPGSGNDVTWTETLGSDPAAAPTVATPGSDVSHWFELTVAPWFSMALCNSQSYPQIPCTPNSDTNAPSCINLSCPNGFPGAGSSFLELQFYPPGFPPFSTSISCDTVHWCASLHINDLECSLNFVTCNDGCVETTNFAFIQKDGIPTGPPSPQLSTLATFTPNSETLLMNPGDKITVHIFDAPAPGGGNALETQINDLTTGQTGFMQASAANGYMQTSFADCSGTPFNYEPEYSTAQRNNVVPWAALQTDISTEYEIGHFTPCTSVSGRTSLPAGIGQHYVFFNNCSSPYESAADGGSNPEVSDAPCFPAGLTHGGTLVTGPNPIAGCLDLQSGGDIDFDGTPYWAQWPTGTAATPLFPGSFVQSMPTTGGAKYSQFFAQTDVALSETTCVAPWTGCAVPPPTAPGGFYPYWSLLKAGHDCSILFGNVSSGAGVNTMGKYAQYGTNQINVIGYPEFEGPTQTTSCPGA